MGEMATFSRVFLQLDYWTEGTGCLQVTTSSWDECEIWCLPCFSVEKMPLHTWGTIAPTNIKIQFDLTYEENPIRVLEEMERVTQSKVIKFYKVVWNNHSEQDATWEREDYLREVYPAFYEEW